MPLVRVSSVALALIVCAWFALGIRQAHDTTHATAIVSGTGALSAAQAARVTSLLGAAGTLNPDSQVDVLRGELALRQNNRPRAKRILEHVVSGEPANITAWFWLVKAAFGDSRINALALVNINRLDPRG